jgi:hypothetical protein
MLPARLERAAFWFVAISFIRFSLIPKASATERADCPLQTIVKACCLNSSSYLRRTSFVGCADEFGSLFFKVVSLTV